MQSPSSKPSRARESPSSANTPGIWSRSQISWRGQVVRSTIARMCVTHVLRRVVLKCSPAVVGVM